MPFALRLKKVRRYDVARKNLFLLPVQLLDNTIMECTMNETSTGLDLLHHIAQRLTIGECQYFGIKFINRHMQYEWLDSNLPLKEQLHNCVSEVFVKFSVRFYIRNTSQLKDDFTRYQFFLQLRNEIIEGALLCSTEQAVLLGSYSLQAAYGDFDPERHSPRHLRNFFLLPKRMSSQEELFLSLLIQVSEIHRSLQGMSPTEAEAAYIVECQNLEGYGEDYYSAKDASGNDLLLGTSTIGITIKHPTGRPLLSISWSNLKSASLAKKRSICLECIGSGRSSQRVVQVFLENADFSAYVLSNITLQQEFYANEDSCMPPVSLPDADLQHLKPYGLMFRPDPSLQSVVISKQMAEVAQKFSRPDVAEARLCVDEGVFNRKPGPAYRETPSYHATVNDCAESKNLHVGQQYSSRLSSVSYEKELRERLECGSSRAHFPSTDKRVGDANTSSTPELRISNFPASDNSHRQSISNSTPDLLSTTSSANRKRPAIQSNEMQYDLQMMRLAAFDGVGDLSGSFYSYSNDPVTQSRSVSPAEHGAEARRNSRSFASSAPSNPIRPDSAVDTDISIKDTRRLDLEKRLSSGNLLIEFEQIPKKRQHRQDNCSVAILTENKHRNRYADLLPYDDTRIHLGNPTRKNANGYINASDIILKCEGLERRYIAAQEPISGATGTAEDFLCLLSQSQISVVVVLADDPCVPWVPFLIGEKEVSLEGFHLRSESISEGPGFRTVCFWLYDRRSKQSRRKVWAVHYTAWTDQGIPSSVSHFCRMMQELDALRASIVDCHSVTVVCRTGSGRSGMLILFDFMKVCFDHNQNVDLARVLTHMRIQRMHMVQTVSQYRFVYMALVEHLASARLI
ncbi:Tyrosine-protein phosphatase non-receptor type 14 [Hypsibius exemplaris]|uniref:protein-tyrosine-phosphatase n=1 Tax=Hypsibius exemplaris TaxID=2072580 RepID=A0A1W0XES0_HYPEX|nr:Tyrosine-protein phosphatase non-receptor type 14 [Hypsibius exemplaris]